MASVDDFADVAVHQWRQQRPDLDLSAMATLARFARLARVGGAVVDATFAARDLDRGEFDVLATLRRIGPPFALSPSELADRLLVTRGGMTKRIDRLVQRGLVRRQRDLDDRRAVAVSLTADGIALIDRLIVEHCERESALLDVLSDDDRQALDRIVRRLLEHAERSVGG